MTGDCGEVARSGDTFDGEKCFEGEKYFEGEKCFDEFVCGDVKDEEVRGVGAGESSI